MSRWNRSSLHGAFELLLKSKEDLQPQALKVFVSEANTTELEAALDGFLGKVKVYFPSLKKASRDLFHSSSFKQPVTFFFCPLRCFIVSQ